MRSVRRHAVLAAALAAAVLSVTPALAVTGGEPDGTGHPNVGALIADLPGSGPSPVCSGTLVSDTVFLTAGHCTASLAEQGVERVWVTFDAALEPESWSLVSGTYRTDPAFGHDRSDLHDLAVVLLDVPVAGIVSATLPQADLLDRLALRGGLRGATFANVGYGYKDRLTGGGPPEFAYDGLRRVSTSSFAALTQSWLKLSNHGSGGDQSGVCFGDSGGPRFLGTTILAVTGGGDSTCSGMSASYRLDTPSARRFLGQYVTLP